MENGQYRRTEHHLVLLFDELDELSKLFNLPIKSVNFDVKGSKSLKRDNVQQVSGITACTHTFISVNMKENNAYNHLDVQHLIGILAEYGATTCYIARLIVEWTDGRVDQWDRRAIPGLARYVSRSSGIRRNNVLTIIRPTPDELVPLGERYGGSITSPTNCPVRYVEGKEVRSCAGLQKMYDDAPKTMIV